MGKYTRKAKMTIDVSLMDVSQSHLGVRTRAKTLALQRLQSAAAALPSSKPDACYLELRSRRLEKTMQPQNSRNLRRSCGCRGRQEAEIGSREECSLHGLISGTIEGGVMGIEASFGENNLDSEVRERGTRENTPCSLVRGVNAITTPGSTTKRTCSSGTSQRVHNESIINGPCAHELEEFFAHEEESTQRHFTEKYNFDVMKDLPLPGRYEWVAVMP